MNRTSTCFEANRVLMAVMFCVTSAAAASAQGTAPPDPVRQSWAKNQAVINCDQCHYAPRGGLGGSDFSYSRQNELQFWLANDKHAIARRRVEPLKKEELLGEAQKLMAEYQSAGLTPTIIKGWLGASNVLSRRMCDKLGYDVKTEEGYNQFRDNCLTCHGGYRHDIAADKVEFAKGQPGVSCNYCHQVGEDSRWVNVHGIANNKEKWRDGSPADKERIGYRNVVQTAKQADLCFDCHVGNRQQNQFVTHEMFAAGHPPLPSVELHTFCDQMPMHWRTEGPTFDALPADRKAKYFQQTFPGVGNPKETFWNTRRMLIGALAARGKTLDLLIDSTAADHWADYSMFDCAACHHELKTVSKRQLRGYPGAPGRPRQPEWPDSLFHIGLFLAQKSDTNAESEVMALEAALADRFSEQPFGDQQRTIAAAKQLRARINTAIEAAEATPITADVAQRVMKGLAATPSHKLLSYDSARQVVWAMKVIAKEIEDTGGKLPAGIQAKLDQLGTGMETELPAGRDKFIYPDSLKADLDRRAGYDPEPLTMQLRDLHGLLSADIRKRRAEQLVSQSGR